MPPAIPQKDVHHIRIINKLPDKISLRKKWLSSNLQSIRQNVECYDIKSTGFGSEYLGLNPGSSTYFLCNLVKPISHLQSVPRVVLQKASTSFSMASHCLL